MSPRGTGAARPLRRRPLVTSLLVAAVLLLVAAACSPSGGPEDAEAAGDVSVAAPAPPPPIYVAVGGADALGAGSERPLRQAWPRLVYRTLDRGAIFVNAAAGVSTVAEAMQEQVPIALEVDATLVTVWLNLDDLGSGVPPATYERELADVVRALRQDGRARVLVANTPPAEALSAFDDRFSRAPSRSPSDELAADVAAYNEAIERVVTTEGAELVDLHTTFSRALADGSFPSLVDDFGLPSTLGHQRIADAFIAAL